PGLAAAGPAAPARQGPALLPANRPGDVGRGAELVPRPTLYPRGRWRLRRQGAAGRPGRTGDVRRPGARRRGRLRPARAQGQARRVHRAKPSQRGPKAHKGPRLPSPKQAAAQADRKRTAAGDWVWRELMVTAYGEARVLQAFTYEAVWPTVSGLRPVRVVVVR